MKRQEAVRALATALAGHTVVGYAGAACEELYAGGDEDRFVYVLGSMGLASSIGLGIALCGTRPVLAFEGDGSILMNLGALVTAAARAPRGFVLAIIDNGQHASTGGQPTATAAGLDIAAVARACGWTSVRSCASFDDLQAAGRELAGTSGPLLLHVRVEPGDGVRKVVDLDPRAIVARARRRAA